MEGVYCTVMYCVYGYSEVFILKEECLLCCGVMCVRLLRSTHFEGRVFAVLSCDVCTVTAKYSF